MTPAPEQPAHGITFWIALVLGWTIVAFGLRGVAESPWLRDRPQELAVWALGGLVLHDALLAPFVTVVGLLIARRLPTWLAGPVRAASVVSGITLLFAYPLLRGFGRRAVNPSILPADYGTNVLAIIISIWVAAIASALWRRARA